MAVLEAIDRYAHLGNEFLTHLWWLSERRHGVIELDGVEQLEILVQGPMLLEANLGDADQVQLKGEDPASAPEAAAALAENKQLRKCRLIVTLDGVEWPLALDAQTLAFSAIRIPAPSKGLAYDDAVALRMEQMDRLVEVFLLLFNGFLELRLDEKKWANEVRKIRKWIAD
ncbi:hypothetical protein ACFL34_05975, partial [Candidatus Sumerlaeota bacterium]